MKNQNRYIAIPLMLAALTLIVIILLTGCGSNNVTTIETTTAVPTEPTIPERFLEKNSIFLMLGDEITVDGVTYTASMLYENTNGYAWCDDDGYFVVNRINGHVSFVCHSGAYGSRSSTEYAIDTGLVYTGTITIADTEFEVPVATKEGVE